jgi:hypothetical protein
VEETVTISLTMDEALVLFEWLATANEKESLTVDAAKRRVLCDLESMLRTAAADAPEPRLRRPCGKSSAGALRVGKRVNCHC